MSTPSTSSGQRLTWAMTKKQWELASLCLLLGMLQALSKLPPDAVEGLIEALGGPDDGRRGH